MFKVVLGVIIFIVSLFVFSFLEFESSLGKIDSLIQPLIFAATLSIGLCLPRFKKIILLISLSFLMVMIFTYVFNQINLSNWIGSLGFGMLVITVATYLPELIKRGYIEKF